MVSPTFKNLAPEKKERINAALLTEFSTYPLKDAQVARIVKDAQIARGAFYKYFTDLNEAYDYLYHLALVDIHADLKSSSPQEILNATRAFITASLKSSYYDLLKLHLTVNELPLAFADPSLSATRWALATLSHQTLREALNDPQNKELYLKRLEQSITLLVSKDN
ncbi:TetR/AcrR family transcriptional regulator [Ligilactobacillus animalis]|jgi:AcrR family transcriptional regulator|uniref:TetR/AcrR family transcriptional regulator n=1 Tax=Ligilactobacillus animalis TaxID=1605 RepID=UPI0025966A71|nr:TetR/AcrR family transcriptional regulator [Ligilactobacillus animalis]